MANIIETYGTYGRYYYVVSDLPSDRLSSNQMEKNVRYIYSLCKDKYPTWTTEAISAMCGNAQSEGILNPGQWQYNLGKDPLSGYGLFQWTPSTNFTVWATNNNFGLTSIDAQIARVEYERANGIQYYKTDNYPFSFTDFLTGDHTVADLARAWLYNYERPKNPAGSEALRVERSENWYRLLAGAEPEPPGPEPPGPIPTRTIQQKMKFFMYPSWRNNVNHSANTTANRYNAL